MSNSRLTVWIYDWPDGQGPVFVVAKEWVHGEMSAITTHENLLWFSADESDDRAVHNLRFSFEDSEVLARAIATGSLRRIGELPALCVHRWVADALDRLG